MSNGLDLIFKEILQAKLANDPLPRLTITVKSSISTHKPGKIHNNGKDYS